MEERTKYDCFAYEHRGCRILKRRYCDNEVCSFYKRADKDETKIAGNPAKVWEMLSAAKLNPKNWTIISESKDAIVIRHKVRWRTKRIQKQA